MSSFTFTMSMIGGLLAVCAVVWWALGRVEGEE